MNKEEYLEKGNELLGKKKYRDALKIFKNFADSGDPEIEYKLGVIYENIPNTDKAIEFYKLSSDKNYAPAQCALGIIYYNRGRASLDTGENLSWWSKAADLFLKSANQGNDIAQAKLGSMYYAGNYFTRDVEKAKEWWTKAAEKANSEAIIGLSLIKD